MPPSRSGAATRYRPPAPEPRAEGLGPIALLSALRKNPIEVWRRAHFEEPIVFDRFAFGRVAVVSDPAAIRKVLVENVGDYCKSALQKRVLSVALRDGLLTVEGERWRRQRRTLAPMFTRRTVTSYAPTMIDAVDAVIERWRAWGPQHRMDLGVEMNRLALDGLIRSCFADGLGGDPETMRKAMTAYFEMTGRIDPFDILGLPGFVPRLTQWSVRPLLRYFDTAVTALIVARRAKLVRGDAPSPDLLAALLEATDPETGAPMSDLEVKANVLTFVAAGQEATANAITWALYLLCHADRWRGLVLAEADDAFGDGDEGVVDRLPLARAVVDEALRLYPPITATSRTAGQAHELAGHAIEAGTMVVVAPYVLHRHRRLWDDPDLFDPGRFLPSADRKIERGAFLPFGTGARMCLGASFAHQEATVALARLVRAFDFTLVPGQAVWPQQKMTLRPRDPLLMTAAPRARGES